MRQNKKKKWVRMEPQQQKQAKQDSIWCSLEKGICLLLVFLGTILMYRDVTKGTGSGIGSLLAGGVFLLLLAFSYDRWQGNKKITYITTIVIAIAALWFRKAIGSGFIDLCNHWIGLVNDYYDEQFLLLSEEAAKSANSSVFAVFLFACLAFFLADFAIQKKSWTALWIPGMIVILAGLCVGYAPGEVGLFLFLAGVFGMRPYCKKRKEGALPAKQCLKMSATLGVTVLCLGGLVFSLGASPIQKVVKLQADVLAKQKYFEQVISSGELFSFFQGDYQEVTNKKPYYTEREVLTLTTDAKPKNSVYLRGKVGDTYQDGRWGNEGEDAFERESKNWKIASQEDIASTLYEMPYESQGSDGAKITYTIAYQATGDRLAYLPYLTLLSSAKEPVTVNGDGTVQRTSKKEQAVSGINYDNVFDFVSSASAGKEQQELDETYRNFCERYLDMPQNLDELDALGQELNTVLQDLKDKGAGQMEVELAAICMVRDAVNSRVTYDLDLDAVPQGKDVVENFLFHSGKGYCTHYASAGTLLFRELGIPARYVTGYVVERDEFEREQNKQYVAGVKDSASHAWVEVYLENIGWFPIEMISGFDDQLDSMHLVQNQYGDYAIWYENQYKITSVQRLTGYERDMDVESWDNPVSTYENLNKKAQDMDALAAEQTGETQTTERETANQENTKSDIKNAMSEAENGKYSANDTRSGTGSNVRQQGDEESGTAGGANRNDAAGNTQNSRWIFVFLLNFFIAITVVVVAIIIWKARVCAIERACKQRDTRKAVKNISKQLYLQMKRKHLLPAKKLDDAQFFKALENADASFSKEEIARLKEIIERAAYSNEAIEVTEAKFCYGIYLRLKKHPKKKA